MPPNLVNARWVHRRSASVAAKAGHGKTRVGGRAEGPLRVHPPGFEGGRCSTASSAPRLQQLRVPHELRRRQRRQSRRARRKSRGECRGAGPRPVSSAPTQAAQGARDGEISRALKVTPRSSPARQPARESRRQAITPEGRSIYDFRITDLRRLTPTDRVSEIVIRKS